MNSSFDLACAAARAAAGLQHYPQSALYVVATPIGNLADISLRALHVLQLADVIACEDKRHSLPLLRQYGVCSAGAEKNLLAIHQHNEAQAADQVLQCLAQGQRVAYISDAGTPAISDPGARLVAAVRLAGWRVVPIPGASSVTCVLSAAGLVGEPGAASLSASSFIFAGFLPSKAAERNQAVAALAVDTRPTVILEAPHRIAELAQALAVLGERPLTVGRELTKQFEEIATLPCSQFAAWLAASAQRSRGEFALVLHAQAAPELVSEGERVLQHLLPELPLKTAVQLAAKISGASRNALYETALKWKNP